jgi:hypothetical protein
MNCSAIARLIVCCLIILVISSLLLLPDRVSAADDFPHGPSTPTLTIPDAQ